MIQRIQSIFLLLVTISLFSTYFFPIGEKVVYEINEDKMFIKEKEILYIYELVHHQKFDEESPTAIIYSKPHIIILILMGGTLAFYSIFQYNNRLKQIKIGAINSVIMSSSLGIILYELFYLESTIKGEYNLNILLSFYLIFAALIFNSIANRFIRKDEILVNESDRIR